MKNVVKFVGLFLIFTCIFCTVSSVEAARTLGKPTWKSSSVSGSKIYLAWKNVAGAGSFTLYYKLSTSSRYSSATITGTAASFTGTLGKTYNFYLVANPLLSSDRKSSASAVKTVSIPNKVVKLATPSVSSLYGGYMRIAVYFTIVPNSTVYAIQYRVRNGTSSTWKTVYVQPRNTSWLNTGHYVLTGLKDKTSYEIRVSARATKGSGFSHSNFSASKTKKTNSGTVNSSGTTFVDYNIQRDSYRINW